MPWMIVSNGNTHCVHKQNDDKTAGEKMKCYPSKEEANKYMAALYANTKGENLAEGYSIKQNDAGKWCVYEGETELKSFDTEAEAQAYLDELNKQDEDTGDMQQDFLFVELSTLTSELKYIDGLAAGTFTAMNGREVSFSTTDLPQYIANTQAIIDSTMTEKGEVVGLPIDKDGHDHKGGAGWIVGLELDTTRNIIKFIVKWTKEGIDLIKGNVRRFFSPSADPNEKIILGGSLTNWPATRGAKGQMLLRPVELSQNIKEIDMEKTLADLQAENDALTAKLEAATQTTTQTTTLDDGTEVKELNEWMSSAGDGLEELSRQAQAKAELIIRAERRKDKAVEFASRVIGGTREKPFGLPIKSSRLVKLLLSLPEKQAVEVQELIGLIYKNAIDFAEHGIDGYDYSMKPKLPAEFAEALRIWVDSGKKAVDWFAEMSDANVGKAEDWNLTEFSKAEG
jgi:hypothetical protein